MKKTKSRFYTYLNIILLILVVLGFGGRLLLKPEDLPEMTWLLGVHANFMFAWFILVIVQSVLINRRKHKIHMNLGWASIGIAVGIVATAAGIITRALLNNTSIALILPNLSIIIGFIVLFGAGIIKRKDFRFHNRVMMYASIVMMSPALARLSDILIDTPLLSLPISVILLISIPIHDWVTVKKILPGTIFGFVVALVPMLVQIGVGISGAI